MRIKSRFEFKCERERVWDKLTDINVLDDMIPWLSGLRAIGENRYQGELRVELGPIYGCYQFRFEVSHFQRHERFTLNFESIDSPMLFEGDGTLQLEQKDTIATLRFVGQLYMGGQAPGNFRKKAKRRLEQSLEMLFKKIEAQCCEELEYAH